MRRLPAGNIRLFWRDTKSLSCNHCNGAVWLGSCSLVDYRKRLSFYWVGLLCCTKLCFFRYYFCPLSLLL